jgi:hypothetical protein
VKQFDDLIEEHPDFMTLRNHIAKTVAGDGKKVMLMGALWRLIRAACQLSSRIPYEKKMPEPEPYPAPASPDTLKTSQEYNSGEEEGAEPG